MAYSFQYALTLARYALTIQIFLKFDRFGIIFLVALRCVIPSFGLFVSGYTVSCSAM